MTPSDEARIQAQVLTDPDKQKGGIQSRRYPCGVPGRLSTDTRAMRPPVPHFEDIIEHRHQQALSFVRSRIRENSTLEKKQAG